MADSPTRWQLACGVVAAPLFFAVSFAQAFTREGFDISRHYLSQLATGNAGWLQMANFITAGTLYVLCAAGMRKALSPGRGATWGPRLIGTFGLGLIAAGAFSTDPAGGFPPGSTVEGSSWHGALHQVAAMGAGLALLAGTQVFARRFAALKQRGWASFSAASGILYTVLPWTSAKLGGLVLAVASMIGWGWISIIAGRLLAQHTDPSESPTRQLEAA